MRSAEPCGPNAETPRSRRRRLPGPTREKRPSAPDGCGLPAPKSRIASCMLRRIKETCREIAATRPNHTRPKQVPPQNRTRSAPHRKTNGRPLQYERTHPRRTNGPPAKQTEPPPQNGRSHPRKTIGASPQNKRSLPSKQTEPPLKTNGASPQNERSLPSKQTEPLRKTNGCRPFGGRHPHSVSERSGQKIDSSVRVVSSSSAFMPITELPLPLSRGLHTATEYFCGQTAAIPPPTPLLPGNPTRKENSPASS